MHTMSVEFIELLEIHELVLAQDSPHRADETLQRISPVEGEVRRATRYPLTTAYLTSWVQMTGCVHSSGG
jgi:hypothetical protein